MTDKKRDPGEIDNSAGYVSLSEIQNLWVTKMRQLDKEIWPDRSRMPPRDEVIEFFATLKIELFKRAQSNYVEFCRRIPDPAMARPKKPSIPPPSEASSESEYKERKTRLSKWS